MSWRRIAAVMRKEIVQIRRDRRSLLIILAMPLAQLLLNGYAVNLDARHVPLCLYDRDRSQASDDLLAHFRATDSFDVVHVSDSYADLVAHIDASACTVGVVIPTRFSERLRTEGHAAVQALVDASDSNTASLGMGYAQGIVQAYAGGVQLEWQQRHGGAAAASTIAFEPRTLFNEELESMANIVPGVIALVMAVVGSFLTSLTVAREWERGTMEQLIATPIAPFEIQIGKLIPYYAVGILDTAICAGVAVTLFHVPFRGSWIVLFGCSLLFLAAVLSLGYYISVTSRSQVAASQFAMLTTFLPTMLLSGFIFPIDQMPRVVQWITWIFPGRYYVSILRSVFLKGTPASLMLEPIAGLAAIAMILTLLAGRAFHKRLA